MAEEQSGPLGPASHVDLELAMADYDRMDPKRIHHFVKVHAFARDIGLAEGLDEKTLYILEAAAIVHDAGIHESERIYGNAGGKHQEELGPRVARPLLEKAGYAPSAIERILWLIAHHHTYADIEGADYQILVEADFLTNIYEDAPDDAQVRRHMAEQARKHIFRTATGIRLLEMLYLS